MLEPRIQQHFFESADLMYQVAEHLSRPIAEAAQAVTGCLTGGGRLLVHSHGGDELARLVCDRLLAGFERPRPPLAAWPLGSATPPDLQLQAMGQAGDLLLLLCPLDEEPQAAGLIERAHAKDMSVVMFSGGLGGRWPSLLRDTDVWVAVPHARRARIQEVHLLALHALCDAIDLQLLGEADAET
jgi:D-sedoheptulose 7-phosphate isomerase